jgi:hypothetical protein
MDVRVTLLIFALPCPAGGVHTVKKDGSDYSPSPLKLTALSLNP